MVSEIKGAGNHAAQALNQGLQQSGKATTGAGAGAGTRQSTPGEVVTVTDLGQRLQKLSQSVEGLPVVDQKRVSEIREAIASGNYQIDDRQIADKLTALEQQLGVADSE